MYKLVRESLNEDKLGLPLSPSVLKATHILINSQFRDRYGRFWGNNESIREFLLDRGYRNNQVNDYLKYVKQLKQKGT